MRIPLSWLREYVPVPTTGDARADADALHAALVKVGLEEEDVHGAALTGPIVVGQVLEFVEEPQANGKTIRWCQVQTAPGEVRGIVCGARNFHVGDKVVVTLPGAVLPGPFPIAARKTYGHVSDGMIASSRELGLGDDHDGILRLETLGLDPAVGTDAIALLGLDDIAVEVNVTPDRGYALSIRGIAREYSHSTGAAFRDPAALPTTPAEGFRVVVDDRAPIRGRRGCDAFVSRVVRGIDPSRPTPSWMSSRLQLAGIRSISLVVDITNYVMLELGQPIHAYDLAALQGGITVRRAAPGESLETLDGQTRTLHPEDLLITDESGPIGLAGGTVDTLGSRWIDAMLPTAIHLPEGAVDRLIGVDFSLDEITDTLTAIGCRLEVQTDGWQVTPPSWRPDLVDAPSLAEEVARIVGYDRIPAVLPVAPPGRGLTREQRVRRAVADALAASGFTEVLAYPFSSRDDIALTDGDAPSVALANPFDSDQAQLRRSLLPGLTRIAHRNIARGLTDLAVFEIGHVFQPESGRAYGVDAVPGIQARPEAPLLDALEHSIPAQPWYLAALLVGDRRPRGIGQAAEPGGVADALAAAHLVANVAGAALRVEQGSHPALHPGRTAALFVGDLPVGVAGELLPAVALERDLPRRVGVLELDLDALMAAGSSAVEAGVIAGFPAATQDLSLVVAESVPAGAVRDAVVEGAGDLLESATLVDDYRGTGLEPGTKSLTLALRFRASDRTLTAAEATEAKLAGLAVAADRFGATLRA